ncbi:hypothetical protein FA95DRAFT_1506302 [Auriscalpium vulgare]|uniref:Uncharacterized protein n=1 Tax=Auriscalpium vulgare TaxID=40419 RepID=A0ACB8R1Z5_9AGAM|nr:hypothetical protein FA95DRAFT_1506302 [Auriscalpium vulgare]
MYSRLEITTHLHWNDEAIGLVCWIDFIGFRAKYYFQTHLHAPKTWNAAIIHPDGLGQRSLESLDDLFYQVDLCSLSTHPSESLDFKELACFLGSGHIRHIADFYDRPIACANLDWYYSAFAIDQNEAADLRANTCASIIAGVEGSVRGRVLVVKNGALGGSWAEDESIDRPQLARCLWWYHHSGSTVPEVLKERRMMAWMSSLNL